MEPTAFGKYLLTERIAEGGMAVVWRAKVLGPGGFEKEFCVKQIRAELAAERQFVDLFVAEAKVTVSLSHANIVPIYELGMVDDTYFLALELIDGPPLARLLKGGPLPPPLAAYVLEQVLRGLDYAHRRGVVHRDLTPANVLVSRDGEVKIVDFGIAASVDARGVRAGSRGYMAPEQERGGRADTRSDLYAAGVLLGELLVGKRTEGPLGDAVPAPLGAIVERATRAAPEERFADAAAMLAELSRYLRDLHVEGAEAPTQAALSAFVRRRSPDTPRALAQGGEPTPRTGAQTGPRTVKVGRERAGNGTGPHTVPVLRGSHGTGPQTALTDGGSMPITLAMSDSAPLVLGLAPPPAGPPPGDADAPVAPLLPPADPRSGTGRQVTFATRMAEATPAATGPRRVSPVVWIVGVGLLAGGAGALALAQLRAADTDVARPIASTAPPTTPTGASPTGATPTGTAPTAPAPVGATSPPPNAPTPATTAHLVVRTTPPGAEVRRGDKLLGTTPLELDVPVDGPALLTLRRRDHQPLDRPLRFEGTPPAATVNATLAPLGHGTLTLNALPWAHVFIDGKPRRDTPLQSLELPVGPHQVRLVCPPTGRELKFAVTIEPDAELRRVADLRGEPHLVTD